MKQSFGPTVLILFVFHFGCGGELLDAGEVMESALIAPSGWVLTSTPSDSGEAPIRAVDGNSQTRWSTGHGMRAGDFFQVDLGTCRPLNRVVMSSGSSSGDQARGYRISTSLDGTTWGEPVAAGAGTASRIDRAFPEVPARFVRIVQTGAAGNWWSLHDLELYEGVSGGCGAARLDRASFSGPREVLDNDFGTRWTTGHGMRPGDTLQVDLGTCADVERVVLDSTGSPGDHPRGYAVYVSLDGSSWNAAVASGNPSGSPVDARFGAARARYVRVVQTGSSGSWWSVHELNVFGTVASSCASASPPAAPPVVTSAPGTFRLATWNTRFGTDRWQQPAVGAQIAEMASWGADVIFLQEADGLEDTYLAGLRARDSAWVRVPGVQAILTRLPLAGSESRQIGPNSWGPNGHWALRADVRVGGRIVHLYNTHLDIAPNICGDVANHVANRNAFIAFTEEQSGPSILGGDLNAWSWSPAGCDYQRDTLSALWARYRDACEDLGGNETSCNDASTFLNESGTRWRPDHLFRNGGVRYTGYTIRDSALSDHKPVMVDVQVP